MKKTVLTIALSAALISGGILFAQEQPKPKKDTVNIDTDAKPKFYYAVEDEESLKGSGKSSAMTIAIIVAAVVVVGGVAFFLLKKKK